MPYNEMLKKIMNEKKLTNAKVVEECNKQGINISQAYFSKIKNDKKNPPSEEISRAIAKACNVDERLLVIEGYIDKSPQEIQEVFKILNCTTKLATIKLLRLIEKGNMKKLQEYLDTQPISDTLIEILDSKDKCLEFIENNYTFENLGNGLDITMSLKNMVGFEINDDAMFPILQKGDTVQVELKNSYKSSDILLINYHKNIIPRYVFKINDTCKLVPINQNYKEIICPREEIEKKIIGRVNTISKKI